jgi:hypothetical protein
MCFNLLPCTDVHEEDVLQKLELAMIFSSVDWDIINEV